MTDESLLEDLNIYEASGATGLDKQDVISVQIAVKNSGAAAVCGDGAGKILLAFARGEKVSEPVAAKEVKAVPVPKPIAKPVAKRR